MTSRGVRCSRSERMKAEATGTEREAAERETETGRREAKTETERKEDTLANISVCIVGREQNY